jgi:predicted DNA-binding protein with PD1-like motif
MSTNSKKTIIARLDEGEDLFCALKECAEKNNIKCGWFSAIGGLKVFTYGLYENGEYRKISKRAKHCFELLPTFGNITLKEGGVLIHAHVNASDEDQGISCGGHLMEGSIIFPFAEVVIQECEGTVDRAFDKKTNLWPLKFKG